MLQKLQNLAAFSSACQALRAGKSPLLLDGLAAVHKAHFAAALCRELGRGAVLLTDEEAAATRLMEDINRFYGEERALLYPEREFTYHSVESVSREYEQLRLGVLRRLQRDPSLIVVGTVTAALQPTLLPEQLSAATLSLRVGQEYPPQKLLEFLVQVGYQRAEQVEGIGQFAARGGIVDFYPPQYSWPIRLEYWGDEVDSIAAFSLESQRREDSMKLVEITPVRELLYHPAELAAHCMEDIDKDFVKNVKDGDIMVGGWNFGCGSSREHAPVAIKAAGISVVIAKSFARIFYRNSINIGLPIMECPEAVDAISAGDTVSVDFTTGLITDETTGKTFQAEPFPPFIQKIIADGGLMKSIKNKK